MSRRRSVTLRCAESGCLETALYDVRTIKEDRELRAKPWRCLRHTHPERVLTADHSTEAELVCVEKSYGRFWFPEGAQTGSGFAHGDGYYAYAKDFAPGTRLIVTARIEVSAS